MKKKLTFMFVALITVAAFAIQSKRAASALIDYPTSQSGITLYTLGTDGGVKFSEVAVKGTNVSAIEFGKSIKNTETEKYYAELSVEGGFKAGDIITINGCYSNKDTKETAIVFYKADLSTELWKTDKFPNVNDGTTDVLVQSYTLTEDVEKIYCGRSGGTKTYLTKLTITREEASGDKYNVTVDEGITNGTVKVDKATAAEGEEVTITATPAEGYMLDAISVTCKTINQAVNVKNGKFTMPADDVTVNATFKVAPVDVAVAAGDITGGDITAAIAAKAAGKPVGNVTLTLAAGAYTVSAPIIAAGSIVVNGATGATIDASAVSAPLFQYGVPAASVSSARRAPATPVDGYTYIDNVSIKDVTITGVKGSIYWDGNVKVCIENFSIDNAVIALETESSSLKDNTLVSFQGGCAKDFTVKNSTIYGNGVAKYFNKANNGADFVKGGYTEATVTYESNTFYNLLNNDGQWGNNLRYNNNYSKITLAINNNIWVDCGNGQILRRMLNKDFANFKEGSTMANNVYNSNGAVVDQGTYGNGSDINGIVAFKDATNGDFNGKLTLAPGTTAPATMPGDKSRWTLTTAVGYAITIADGIENGTIKADAPYAAEGATVTVTATPADGYMLDAISVTCKTIDLAVEVKNGKFTMPADDVTVNATFKVAPVDVDVKAGDITGGDITAAIAAKAAGKPVGNLTINLAAGAYTVSAPIIAAGSIVVNGATGATIDASAVSASLFQYGVPAASVSSARRAPATPVDGYTYIDNVSIKDVTITGVKGSIYWDGNVKVCIENFSIDNAVIALETESSSLKDNTLVSFQGGCAKDFTVKNSTIYGNGVAKYFNKANNGADFVKGGYTEATVTYESNTFYNLLNNDGQWGNNLRYNNNYSKITLAINNNIWVDCGNGQILRRMLNKDFANFKEGSTMANNIYNSNGAVVDQANYGNGSDINGIVAFKDVANGDFNGKLTLAPGTTAPATMPGDKSRWTLTTAVGYAITIADGIENGTIKADAPYAAEGATVTVTATPADGYMLDAISVTCKTIDLAVEVKNGKFTMPADDVTVNATFKVAPVDVEVKADEITGGDITAAIAAKAAGKPIANLTINLAAGAYTVSAPIIAAGSIVVNGATGATIDASAVSAPLFQYGAPAASVSSARRAPATPVDGYTYIDNVSIKDVTITGVKGSIYWDGNVKVCIENFSIDNAVIALETESSSLKDNTLVSFQGGCAKDFTVKNSTIYGNGVAKYFNKANNGADFVKGGYTEATVTYESNTFYNLLNNDGQWGNNLRYNNNYSKITLAINNNIWVDCGNGQILRRMLNKDFANFKEGSTMANNIYNSNGAVVDQANYGNGSDVNGRVNFAKAAEGKFDFTLVTAPGTTAPASVGDQRWAMTVAVGYAITVGECTGGTVKADKPYAAAGEKVYATFTPAEGYSPSGIVGTFTNDAGEDVTKDITFGEDETGKYIVMPAFNITVSVVFKPLPKFYIIGDMNSWDRTAMTEMTYNAETEKYEYEYAPTTTVYFAFSDKQLTAAEAAADADWSIFNSTNRYALGAGNVDATLNEIKSLTKGVEGTIVLNKVKEGTSYKISVEKDFNAVTITGEAAPILPYVVAGSSTELFGTAWAAAAEANAMTLNETTGKYEITYSNVTLSAGDIEYKIVKDGSTWIPDGENKKLNIPAAGTYDVTFTFDPATNEITAEATVPTGINGIYVDGEAADIFSDGKPVYNLSGQRVFKGYKGVVIKNGKKIVVK